MDYRPQAMYGPRTESLFEAPKLVFRHISGENDSLVVSLDYDQIYCDHGLILATYYDCIDDSRAQTEFEGYEISPQAREYSLEYLLAIFASSLSSWHYSCRFATGSLQGTYSHVYPQAVRSFPVCKIKTPRNRNLSRQELPNAQRLYEEKLHTEFAELKALVNHHLDEGASDVVHDILAFLAEQMIDLNKQKQAEIKRFLAWLEQRLAIIPTDDKRGLDVFTGKTIIQGYLGDYQKDEPALPWVDFYYRLNQNKNRYHANLADVQGEIQAAYEASLAVLLPIKEQLAATDTLIDQIVYQLYGLTDEEIELIERPAYEQALADAKQAVMDDTKLDDEEKIDRIAEQILLASQRYQERVNLEIDRTTLNDALPQFAFLTREAQTFLVTGEHHIRTQLPGLDFAPCVQSFAKAVEQTLGVRLFARFRDESGATVDDCRSPEVKRFIEGGKAPTLRPMSDILRSKKEKALRAFGERIFVDASNKIFGSDGVAGLLADEAMVTLRNRAAHDEVLTREDAVRAREWALAILVRL